MELYHRPANTFVARFIGSPAMNVIPAKASSSELTFADSRKVILPGYAASGDVQFGIRPEHLHEAPEAEAVFVGTVTNVERLGEHAIVHVDIGTTEPMVSSCPMRCFSVPTATPCRWL